MTVSLYTFVDLFARQLGTLEHLLAKGAEHAKAVGRSEDDMLDWRLIEDNAAAPLPGDGGLQLLPPVAGARGGLPLPQEIGADSDLASFRAAIADAKTYLAGLTPEQFAGRRDDVPLTVTIGTGMEPTLRAPVVDGVRHDQPLFHLSTAYGILRSKGVPDRQGRTCSRAGFRPSVSRRFLLAER